VTRICLRQLLAGYLELDPRALAFEEGLFGKPHLSYPAAASGIEFNLSHSGAFVLFAFSLGRRVGIDVESIRRVTRRDSIARRYFSDDEVAFLSGQPEEARDRAFFQIWTRKEAFIKAVGRGISLPLASFDVHTNPSTVLWEDVEFHVQDLMVDEGCAAALAVEGHARKVCRWVF
jgi:4'-phosphopantetheinyl transferase